MERSRGGDVAVAKGIFDQGRVPSHRELKGVPKRHEESEAGRQERDGRKGGDGREQGAKEKSRAKQTMRS